MHEEGLREFYRGRKVLVTGGLGFIGSNLVRRLLELGAETTVIDACFPDQGANPFNLDGFWGEFDFFACDIGDRGKILPALQDQELVFNLASCTSHVGSLREPLRDLERNCVSQLLFLEALKEALPGIRVVYTGSRSQYGAPLYLPVDEEHPLRPMDINGVHKTTAEEYHRLFHQMEHVRFTSLRLTNVYGPRHQMKHNGQGFLNWFIRLGLCGGEIQLFGDGSQERDFLFVDDAVEALLLVPTVKETEGLVLNLAYGKSCTVRDIARIVSEITGCSRREVPYPPHHRVVEPGSIRIDCSRLKSLLQWSPKIDLAEGIRRTIDFYLRFGEYYHLGEAAVLPGVARSGS
jgi:nucleoside-diphosphate-sugar epimerase